MNGSLTNCAWCNTGVGYYRANHVRILQWEGKTLYFHGGDSPCLERFKEAKKKEIESRAKRVRPNDLGYPLTH